MKIILGILTAILIYALFVVDKSFTVFSPKAKVSFQLFSKSAIFIKDAVVRVIAAVLFTTIIKIIL
jgi:hypothetical protein